MSGKKKQDGNNYSPDWGGRRETGKPIVKGFRMARWQANALKMMGDGDIQRGFNLVLEKYKHLT